MSGYKPPQDLIILTRMVMRTFYGFELYLVMEMLIHYPCIKEDQLAEILKLDAKKVTQSLKKLKLQKFISSKTSNDEEYYYINFPLMVNAIKYRLHNIAENIKIKTDELIKEKLYKCDNCLSRFSDFDLVKLTAEDMKCFVCNKGTVDRDDILLAALSKNLIGIFNTQTKRIFDLLREVEHLQLEPHILSPAPADYSYAIVGTGEAEAEIHPAVTITMTDSEHERSLSEVSDIMECNESDDEINGVDDNLDIFITVQRQPILIQNLTPELISRMSENEKHMYTQTVREFYNNVFEL